MGDKLFLLSTDEKTKYLSERTGRIKKYKGEPVWWWLRSCGNISFNASLVTNYGSASMFSDNVNCDDVAVVPALCLVPGTLATLPRTKNGRYVIFGGRKWQVLDEKKELLLSKRAVCRHRFDPKSNDYEKSEIRAYLNNELLYRLFTEEEIIVIRETEITD